MFDNHFDNRQWYSDWWILQQTFWLYFYYNIFNPNPPLFITCSHFAKWTWAWCIFLWYRMLLSWWLLNFLTTLPLNFQILFSSPKMIKTADYQHALSVLEVQGTVQSVDNNESITQIIPWVRSLPDNWWFYGWWWFFSYWLITSQLLSSSPVLFAPKRSNLHCHTLLWKIQE